MAINNVKNTQSLLADIEDWMNNPKFQPQEQNKWFFGEGLSYYTQLCEVVKVLTYLQENFKIVIANEKSLEQAYNEVKDLPSQFTVLSNKVDDLTNTVSDLPTRVQELETKVTKLISDVSSQLTRIETLEGSVGTNTNDITTIKTDITNIKIKDSQQDSKITTLEGKDFLQQVAFNNTATITFTDEGKQDGTQTFSASVTGSIPANLTPNLAYLNNNPNSNIVSNVVLTWNVNENKCYLKKDMSYYSNGNINTVTSRLELDSAWFTINENTLTLKASVLDNYLTKDDAPGYADILTKTLASATYETIENASNYVAKGEAVGYDDILTKTEASGEYETKANASATYETKVNVTDIVDTLISTDTNKPLSANQGHILNEKITSETNRANGAETILTSDLTNEVTRAKAKENELNDKIESTNLEYNIYEGEDLTIKYADEISKYSDEWAWIKARIKAANFKGLRIHDYIPVNCSNNKVLRMEIGGIDTYYRNGSPEVGHHIDFISKECWDVTVQYNKVDINNGTAVQVVPFMASNLKKFLMSEAGPVPNSTTDMSVTTEVDYTNDGIWHFLPDKLKNVIVEKSFFKVNRYTEGSIITTDNTKWEWFNLSKLWLPTEKEVYGSSVYEGNGASYGVFGRQYPCFIGHSRFKGIVGNINARCYWWLLSPYYGNSTSFCNMDNGGNAGSNPASGTHVRVPVCFRVA